MGSTGSVGRQALEVVRIFPDRFRILGISADKNVAQMMRQIAEFKPGIAAMADSSSAAELRRNIKDKGGRYKKTEVEEGTRGLQILASLAEADIVLAAVSGSAGILPVYSAIKSGKFVALANKESMVAAGGILMGLKPKIIPVDSEHSAIFQCLLGEQKSSLKNIILTCSGGPFRNEPASRLKKATAKEALRHPNWKMGPS